MAGLAWLLAATLVGGVSVAAAQTAPPAPLSTAPEAGTAAAGVTSSASARTSFVVERGSHAGPVRRIAADASRGVWVTASDDRSARVWSAGDGRLLHALRPAAGAGDIGRVYGVAIHPTEDLVAIGGTTAATPGRHRILFFSLSDGRFRHAIDAAGGDVKRLAWTADGSLLLAVFAGEHAVRAFDRAGRRVYEQRLNAPAYGLAVAADGRAVATSLDGNLLMFRARAGQVTEPRWLTSPVAQPVAAAFSPAGDRVLLGSFAQRTAPAVIDVDSGRVIVRLDIPSLRIGNFMSVAWSRDGGLLAAAGGARDADGEIAVHFFDAASGARRGRVLAARNSIQDLAPLDDRAFAFAAFDGRAGIVTAERLRIAVGGDLGAVADPGALWISDDALDVRWASPDLTRPLGFSFRRRMLVPDLASTGLSAPRLPSGPGAARDWQNRADPVLGGRAVRLSADDLARSAARLRGSADVLLGTNQRLLRLGDDGAVRWDVRTGLEVRAINVSADDRLVVTAMSDGTVRWWRAADGALLVTLLATPDGRWLCWMETGTFDAAAGADHLGGWAVSRDDGDVADFHAMSRFRDRFNRPEAIDQALARLQTAASPPPAWPPVMESAALDARALDGDRLTVPYSVRISAARPVRIEVRVDGRPADTVTVTQEPAADRVIRGVVTLERPPAGSGIQILASDESGTSAPLVLVVPPRPLAASPAAPADARAPAAAPTSERSGVERGGDIVEAAAAAPAVIGDRIVATIVQQPATPPSVATPVAPVAPGSGSTAPASVPPVPVPPAPVPPMPAMSTPAVSGKVAEGPRLVVLAVGISRYQRPEYALGLASKDARDFANALAGQAGKLYRDTRIRVLTDAQANARAVLEGLDWLADTTRAGDVGILFFAGHGVSLADGQYYFLPWEAQHERLADTALPEQAFRSALARMRGRALMFVDTCYGGLALSRAGSSELARMANDLSSAENGVVVFASSSGRQLSEENDAWGNGAFTRAVLQGLAGKADLIGNGRVTFKSLDFYVSEEVRRLTDGRQTPVTISPTGVADFVLAGS